MRGGVAAWREEGTPLGSYLWTFPREAPLAASDTVGSAQSGPWLQAHAAQHGDLAETPPDLERRLLPHSIKGPRTMLLPDGPF